MPPGRKRSSSSLNLASLSADKSIDNAVNSKIDNQPDTKFGEKPLLTLMLPRTAVVIAENDDSEESKDSTSTKVDSSEINNMFKYSKLDTISLKKDHDVRPLWVSEEGAVFVETASPLHEVAQDFLTAIAEPVSRPEWIHEYKLTPYSLYAAVSVGLETEGIVSVLEKLCKTRLPSAVISFIRACTLSYGKIKLVLNKNRYWAESNHIGVLRLLLQDPEIAACRPSGAIVKDSNNDCLEFKNTMTLQKFSSKKIESPLKNSTGTNNESEIISVDIQTEVSDCSILDKHGKSLIQALLGRDEEDGPLGEPLSIDGHQNLRSYSFEIMASCVERVRRRCIELDYPMLEEYDFRNDVINSPLQIDLKPSTTIRPYQERSLSKMFGNGRARSGIIVLPCGAGKTLVGITAACTIRKSCLVLCTSAVAVEQWREQFRHFSTIRDDHIARFTSEHKESSNFSTTRGILVVSTYTMVAYGGKRSYEARRMMELIQKTEWGLLILDEVHVVPANVFRRVLTTVAAHCKMGLTATLVREDDKIDDLNFLIGPKLYEANWQDLARKGHIANVQCAEVWCPMTSEFYREYLDESSSRKRRLLAVMNPRKFQACHFLIDYHEKRGDKIIVFSDNVFALKAYALKLRKPHIYGATGQTERMRVLHLFQTSPLVNTLFLSKVGDTSIDLPEATCLIQISSHYGSRRQEAQRLGRILRAKRRNDENFSAFFYSLVSRDTEEMFYSTKRQQFLVDQGYSFKVINDLVSTSADNDSIKNLAYSTHREQLELLQSVLLATEEEEEEEMRTEKMDGEDGEEEIKILRRKGDASTIRTISGAEGMAYIEYNRPVTSLAIASSIPRHPLFKARFGPKG